MPYTVAFILVALPAGLVVATGTLETPVAGVAIENGQEDHCVETITGLCLLSADLGGGANGWIDATQDDARVLVTVGDSAIEQIIGIELLPDGAVVIDVSAILLPNPAFRILTEEEHRIAAPGEQYGVRWDSSELRVWLWGPSVSQPFSGLGHREQIIGYGSGWFTPDGIGGFNQLRDTTSSDDIASDYVEIPCDRLPPGEDGDCRALLGGATGTVNEATPTIFMGLGVEVVGLGGDGGVSDLAALGARDTASAIGDRAPVLLPALLTRELTQPALPDPGSPSPAAVVPDPKPRDVRANSSRPSSPTLPQAAGDSRPFLATALAAATALVLLLFALYARITRNAEALASPQRAGIVQHLRDNGPSYLHDIALKFDVHRTTILHHAIVLRRLGEVTVLRRGNRAILALPVHEIASLPSPKPRGALQRMLDVLAEAGVPMTRQDLHARLDPIPLRTRNHALRELIGRGLVIENENGLLMSAGPQAGLRHT